MDSILWLLLLIIVIAGLVAVSILLARRYARFKEQVSMQVRESRLKLFQSWEKICIYNRAYLESYSDQDAGRYGQRAQEFQRNFNQTRESILASLQEHIRIRRTLPKWEKPSLKSSVAGFGRLQRWREASREIKRLQVDIDRQEGQVLDVERSLQSLHGLPLETAGQARNLRDLCRETAELLDHLSGEEHITGRTMEECLQSVRNTEADLEKVPAFFYSSTEAELAALPDIKSQTVAALLILEPAWESLNDLNNQAKGWKTMVEELRKTAVILEARVKETDAIFHRLNKSLLLSGEQEELSSLCQKAEEVRANLDLLTVENLAPTLEETKRSLVGLALLHQTLNEYDARLKTFQGLIAKINEELQAVDRTMISAAARQEYPLVWSNSRKVIEEARGRFLSIPPLSEQRTPADLAKHVEAAEACDGILVGLQAATDKVTADLDQLSKLWEQLRPFYTNEWLAGVEQLFLEIKQYDMENNWEPADRAGDLYSDAGGLLKRARENIPSSKSMPIYEQQVGPGLLEASDLAEQEPLFEARRARIESRLRQMQEEEREAVGLHKRIAPVVILFSKEIRSINIPTRHAQNMLAANVTRVQLEKSLEQRDQGNVSRKLEAVRKWERSTAENGAMVYRWVEEDLLKREVSVSACLREIETFAEDLEDDIVVQAHKYDLVFAPQYLDTELLKKQSLDAIQKDAVNLFDEWQEVVECQGELRKFIAPLREEYDRMLAGLKSLDQSCSQLETRLNRDWPPALQTARYLRAKVDNLQKDIGDLRKVKWKRSELQKNYYFLRQRLRDLGSEADNLRQMDEREAAEFLALEKEHGNLMRECARRVHAGNETRIRREIGDGEAFIKSLSDQYRDGRKSGSNKPSALEVKTLLQRKIDAYKQQLVDYNVTRMEDARNEGERGRQFMPTGKEIPTPINRTEFVTAIFRLITDLEKLSQQHADIEEAIQELRSAREEARKSRPVSLELKRLMNSAKGILVEVEKSVPEAAATIDAITRMTGVIKNIFG